MTSHAHPSYLIWLDLEMTGLNPDEDAIIEIATVITNSHLEQIAEGPVLAIYQTEAMLSRMDPWNVKQHTTSGLVERVRASNIDTLEAEAQTLAFIEQYVPAGKSPLCGNSICQDRRFLYRLMPTLEKYFHYRNFDVSTFKECARRWAPDVAKKFKKKTKHQALADIIESIDEMKFYRDNLFILPEKIPEPLKRNDNKVKN